MTRLLAILAVLALAAAPLAAAKLKLKAEAKPFDAQVLKLEQGQVTYKRGGGKEIVAALDDFAPDSAFEIKKQFTERTGRGFIELARFALHRDLFEVCRVCLAEAQAADKSQADAAREITGLADIVQAERAYNDAQAALDAAKGPADVEKIRAQLRQATGQYPGTPGAVKCEALLMNLDQVVLDLKARQQEEEARKAQAAADEETRKKRQPMDDWLKQQETQLSTWQTALEKADKTASDGFVGEACDQISEVVTKAIKLHDLIAKNHDQLAYPGQLEAGAKLEQNAKKLALDGYLKWANWLFFIKNYAQAARVCEQGINLDPRDRRLLSLKVDLDEVVEREAKATPKDG